MAIGLALLLGFTFPQNFDSPYAAASLQDFWRRWHMTLSRWLRDYLYIPLGGNREGPRPHLPNLMLTMLLGGLWHGAAWTFVVWGAIHGTGLVVEHWRRDRPGCVDRAPDACGGSGARGSSRSTSSASRGSSSAPTRLRALGHDRRASSPRWGEASPLVTAGVLLAIVVGIGSPVPACAPAARADGPLLAAPASSGRPPCSALALMLANAMGPQGVAPFIYFQF